jgi:hypothetical protein
MLYRLKDHLKLPSFAPTMEVGFQYSLYAGFNTYFDKEVRRVMDKFGSPDMSMGAAMGAFRASINKLVHSFPDRASRLGKMSTEGLLAIRMFTNHYDPVRCYPLGYQIPVSLNMVVDDVQFHITSKIDFLFTRNNKKSSETVVAVLLSNTDDPIQDLANLSSLRRGLVYASLHNSDLVDRSLPIDLIEINVLGENPIPVTYSDVVNLKSFLGNSLRAVATGFAIPTADPEKCIHCPYQAVCSPKLASVTPDSASYLKLLAEIEALGKGKPYYKHLIP